VRSSSASAALRAAAAMTDARLLSPQSSPRVRAYFLEAGDDACRGAPRGAAAARARRAGCGGRRDKMHTSCGREVPPARWAFCFGCHHGNERTRNTTAHTRCRQKPRVRAGQRCRDGVSSACGLWHKRSKEETKPGRAAAAAAAAGGLHGRCCAADAAARACARGACARGTARLKRARPLRAHMQPGRPAATTDASASPAPSAGGKTGRLTDSHLCSPLV
jgi:hypothetical protein